MSNNLWVGSLSGEVTESDLRNLFEKHGGVDTVTCYPSRNYAFIKLKNVDDAKRAKDNLQGVVLRGNPMKIDFAKPVCAILLGLFFYLFEFILFLDLLICIVVFVNIWLIIDKPICYRFINSKSKYILL